MQLEDFMNEHYPHLQLSPPLFYNWDIGIRFEPGDDWNYKFDYPNSPYILKCYKRAITLFECLHSPMDDLFVVIDLDDFYKGKHLKRHVKIFPRYVDKS